MSEAETQPVCCSECNIVLTEGMDREITEGGVFCRPCFNNLLAQLQQAATMQGEGINYPQAFIGGILGGIIGILVWWGVSVVTGWAIGIIAIVIGFAVGKGIVIFSGGRRSQRLQIMSAVISILSFIYASYLVTRSIILQASPEQGLEIILTLLPDPILFIQVLQAGFEFFDLIFLAIVVYQAWKIPAPIKLGGPAVSNE